MRLVWQSRLLQLIRWLRSSLSLCDVDKQMLAEAAQIVATPGFA
jgi:hypothetical protein